MGLKQAARGPHVSAISICSARKHLKTDKFINFDQNLLMLMAYLANCSLLLMCVLIVILRSDVSESEDFKQMANLL
jgi:hypothetical protein